MPCSAQSDAEPAAHRHNKGVAPSKECKLCAIQCDGFLLNFRLQRARGFVLVVRTDRDLLDSNPKQPLLVEPRPNIVYQEPTTKLRDA